MGAGVREVLHVALGAQETSQRRRETVYYKHSFVTADAVYFDELCLVIKEALPTSKALSAL